MLFPSLLYVQCPEQFLARNTTYLLSEVIVMVWMGEPQFLTCHRIVIGLSNEVVFRMK